MHRIKFLTLLVLAVVVLASCQAAAADGASPSSDAPIPASVEEVPRITPQDLKSLLDAGDKVIVVDARSETSYQASHIARAGSIPLDQIDTRYAELPKGPKIVFYCT